MLPAKINKNLGDMVMAPGVHIQIVGVDFLYHKMFTLGVFIGFDSSPFLDNWHGKRLEN